MEPPATTVNAIARVTELHARLHSTDLGSEPRSRMRASLEWRSKWNRRISKGPEILRAHRTFAYDRRGERRDLENKFARDLDDSIGG